MRTAKPRKTVIIVAPFADILAHTHLVTAAPCVPLPSFCAQHVRASGAQRMAFFLVLVLRCQSFSFADFCCCCCCCCFVCCFVLVFLFVVRLSVSLLLFFVFVFCFVVVGFVVVICCCFCFVCLFVRRFFFVFFFWGGGVVLFAFCYSILVWKADRSGYFFYFFYRKLVLLRFQSLGVPMIFFTVNNADVEKNRLYGFVTLLVRFQYLGFADDGF